MLTKIAFVVYVDFHLLQSHMLLVRASIAHSPKHSVSGRGISYCINSKIWSFIFIEFHRGKGAVALPMACGSSWAFSSRFYSYPHRSLKAVLLHKKSLKQTSPLSTSSYGSNFAEKSVNFISVQNWWTSQSYVPVNKTLFFLVTVILVLPMTLRSGNLRFFIIIFHHIMWIA